MSCLLMRKNFIKFIVIFFPIYISTISLLYSSERLELYALTQKFLETKKLNIFEIINFTKLSNQVGFSTIQYEDNQNYFITSQSIFPIMAYSNNINGGNLNSSIEVGDLTFIGNEEYQAKSGLLFGGGVSLKAKNFYSRGKYLETKFNASIVASPVYDWLQVRNENISSCSKNHIKEWIFLDACASWAHNKREFSNKTDKSISTGITKLFRSGQTFHESSLVGKKVFSDEYQQLQGSVILNSRLQNGYKTKIYFTKGETIKDIISLNYSIGLSINSFINKKPFIVSLSRSFYDGGMFLGSTRDDTSHQISFSYPFYRGINVTLSYININSTIKSFSHKGPLISFSLPAYNL